MIKKQARNIYFAGSIRGDQVGSELYVHIVDHLKKYGSVLTEHVAHAFKNPQRYNIAFTKKDIFQADMEFLKKANVMIAEVSAASHGVGRELCYAQQIRKIPILALHLPEVDVSAMIEWNKDIYLHEYHDLVGCKEIIDGFFSSLDAIDKKKSRFLIKRSWTKRKNK